jgi:hypothetical protein
MCFSACCTPELMFFFSPAIAFDISLLMLTDEKTTEIR